MKLCTYSRGDERRIGFLVGEDRIADLRDAASALGVTVAEADDLLALARVENLPALADLDGKAAAAGNADWQTPIGDVRLHAPYRPLQNPICAGGNTKDAHFSDRVRGGKPWLNYFTKASSSVNDPGAEISWPRRITNQVYAEPQLTVVIGARTSYVTPEDALANVFGYAVATSVSSADLKRKHGQWDKAVSLDTFFNWGPFIATADSVALSELAGRLWLNDRMALSGQVQGGLMTTEEIVSQISFGMALEPGDLLLTGVPEAVGFGVEPERWLQDGDVVRSAIDGIGEIENRVATY
jgi:2-keto-4-pentenoate hydratase/2-oxohepta-3-ene-1,7-dioic acid hydratase in catechol pathway